MTVPAAPAGWRHRVMGRAVPLPVRRNAFVAAGGLIVLLFAAAAAFPRLFTHASPTALYVGPPLSPPSAAHWFGTDELGRDFFARVVYGARDSLVMSVLVVAIGALAGTAIGALAGFRGGAADEVLMRIVDLFLALPAFILALALSAFLGRGMASVVIALSIVWWPGYARQVRGMVLSTKHRLHVQGARALGASRWRIVRRHILPFTYGQLNTRVTQDLGFALVNVAGLSFLGVGAQPPASEWGLLLNAGRSYVTNGWWLTLFPGLAITVWTLGAALLGDGLAARLRGESQGRP
jgi:peptide/nickel transport system permease protein